MRWLLPAAAGLCIVFSAIGMATAGAEPTQPGPTTTSTSDELADMVLDVIEHGSEHGDAPAPTTTPVPAPPQ